MVESLSWKPILLGERVAKQLSRRVIALPMSMTAQATSLDLILSFPRLVGCSSLSAFVSSQVVDESVRSLAFKPMELEIPFNAKQLLNLRRKGIDLMMDISYEMPMSVSQDIGLFICSDSYFSLNKRPIRDFWMSWQPGENCFSDPTFGPSYSQGSGVFSPERVAGMSVGDFNLLPMAADSAMEHSHHHLDDGSVMEMAMSMQGLFVTDLTNSIQKQRLAGLVDAHEPLALFIAADPANPLNEHTMIEAITYRLHQP